jgi:hypothetical protein
VNFSGIGGCRESKTEVGAVVKTSNEGDADSSGVSVGAKEGVSGSEGLASVGTGMEGVAVSPLPITGVELSAT